MNRLITLIAGAVLLATAACNNANRTTTKNDLSAKELAVCDSMDVDPSVVTAIRKYNDHTIEPFHYSLGKMYKDGKEIETDPVQGKGLVVTEKNSQSYNLVFNLKEELRKKGYSIFLLENNFGFDNAPDNIGIIKTTDPYSILKQIGTDGINWDIDNDSLISIIKVFDKKYELELIGASGDWCEFVIHKEPASWMDFAKEVYKVCPDVVDQGTETIAALAQELKATKRLYLWWD
jgi:Domain of unknown function (DUF4253)